MAGQVFYSKNQGGVGFSASTAAQVAVAVVAVVVVVVVELGWWVWRMVVRRTGWLGRVGAWKAAFFCANEKWMKGAGVGCFAHFRARTTNNIHTHTHTLTTSQNEDRRTWNGVEGHTTTESLFWHMRRSDCPHLNCEQNENQAAFSAQLPSSNLVKCVPRTNSPAAPIRLELQLGVLTQRQLMPRLGDLRSIAIQFLRPPQHFAQFLQPRSAIIQGRRWLQDNSGQRRRRWWWRWRRCCRCPVADVVCRLSLVACRGRRQWPPRSRFRRTAALGVKFQTKVSCPGMAAAKTQCECDPPTRSYPAGHRQLKDDKSVNEENAIYSIN